VPQLQKLTGAQSSKMIAINLEQLVENGDAKDPVTDGEDADTLKPKRRATASRAARGQQNKDSVGTSSRKARGNGGGSRKPGTNAEAVEPKKLSLKATASKIWTNPAVTQSITQIR